MSGGSIVSTEGIGAVVKNSGTITSGEIVGATYGVNSKKGIGTTFYFEIDK